VKGQDVRDDGPELWTGRRLGEGDLNLNATFGCAVTKTRFLEKSGKWKPGESPREETVAKKSSELLFWDEGRSRTHMEG